MFDYKLFTSEIQRQSRSFIPEDLSKESVNYILNTLGNFTNFFGKLLYDDNNEKYSDKQSAFIIQLIAEWTFHKLIDLINGEIPEKYRNDILQDITSKIFVITTQELNKNTTQEQIVQTIEEYVQKTYAEKINALKLNSKQRELALSQSSIDKFTNTFQKRKFIKKAFIITTLLFFIGLIILLSIHK